MKKVVLTGDRPSGKLHLGHFVGSLQNRIAMQNDYDVFIMLADLQALTDNFKNPTKVSESVFEVCLDYLAVGIDPEKATIFIQSQIPVIFQLTKLYLNLVTVARLSRNPTIKEELKHREFGDSIPAGFLTYPISQAADITCVNAELVPAGSDQVPMIEQTCEIVDTFNSLYCSEEHVLQRPKILLPKAGARLVGIDGQSKMSKSLNNAIFLSDSADEIKSKVMKMYTDPNHLRVQDPGQVEGNVVFEYLDIFGTDKEQIQSMKEHYQRGGLGDVTVKKYLIDVLENLLDPIRKRRDEIATNKDFVWRVLKTGCEKTKERSEQVFKKVQKAMKLNYF